MQWWGLPSFNLQIRLMQGSGARAPAKWKWRQRTKHKCSLPMLKMFFFLSFECLCWAWPGTGSSRDTLGALCSVKYWAGNGQSNAMQWTENLETKIWNAQLMQWRKMLDIKRGRRIRKLSAAPILGHRWELKSWIWGIAGDLKRSWKSEEELEIWGRSKKVRILTWLSCLPWPPPSNLLLPDTCPHYHIISTCCCSSSTNTTSSSSSPSSKAVPAHKLSCATGFLWIIRFCTNKPRMTRS